MKRFSIVALSLSLLFAVGCSKAEEEQLFTMTAQEQELYTTQINQVLEEYYWSYDGDSLAFSTGIVPEETQANKAIFAASLEADYRLSSYTGAQAVMATAELLHHNGDVAGQVEFIFAQQKLCGVYYTGGYDNGAYSLRERNLYLANGNFSAYENWQTIAEDFTVQGGRLPEEGFACVGKDANGNGIVVSILDGAAQVYRYSGNYISQIRTISPSYGLAITSAVFVETANGTRLALLQTDDGHTHEAGEETHQERVLFYDTNWQLAEEMALEADGYAAIGVAEGNLILFSDRTMEVFEQTGETWEMTKREFLRHGVKQCHITDLDGNGELEYILSDGMDLYVYQLTKTSFVRIWSTHLEVERLYGYLYTGDLNRDGVKEIYICDATGTTIRYVLTERGLRSSNEDIDYGQAIYALDINGDGLDDYWKVENGEPRTGSLYLAK